MFIKSQWYTNVFGKRSKNILDLSQQFDYRVLYNDDTTKYDVVIVQGELDKYLFSVDSEDTCVWVMQNMFNAHVTKEPHAIIDIEDIIEPKITSDATIEDVEDAMYRVLDMFGYSKLTDAHKTMIESEVEYDINDTKDTSIEAPLQSLPQDVAAPLQTEQPITTTSIYT